MDNFYQNCPAKMDDGRFTTNYRSDSCINEQIKFVNGIVRDDDYRYFLQNNGEKLMDSEWTFLKKNFKCNNNACVHSYPLRMDPNNFKVEREKADLLFMSNELPDNLKCNIYADYRLTETNLQLKNMDSSKGSFPSMNDDINKNNSSGESFTMNTIADYRGQQK